MNLYARLRNMKMAIVEDDALLREAMIRYFRSNGCVVDGFADAHAAMTAFGKECPEIVMSDHFLPGPDGLALLRHLGDRHPGTRRILITAHPSPDITREVERAGVDEFILKPFSIEELENSLRRILEGRDGGREDPGRTEPARPSKREEGTRR